MRSIKLTWSPRARGDIDAIHEWVARQNKKAATRVVAEIRKTATLIGQYPGIGRPTNRPRLRALPVVRFPYLVYFTLADREVVILHVRHAARAEPNPNEL
jgi:plasmid stabilization system protein ParE